MSYRHWIALALGLAGAATLFAGCSDDEDACVENSYRCTGQALEQCVRQDGALTFVLVETCGEGEMCRAEHGHCHPGGDGGHAGHGAGGHHEGGAGGHQGGAGGHQGGAGGHQGGAGGHQGGAGGH